MPSTRSAHTYPAAPPVYSPAATAPKYTPNENMNNASCDSKCQYEFSDSQILSYKDEKLELTRTVSDSSVDPERLNVDSKRNYSEDSVSADAPIQHTKRKQCTCKKSLISKVKALVKPNTSPEKRKTSRSKSADSGSSQGSTISSKRTTTSPISQRDPTLSAFRFFSP